MYADVSELLFEAYNVPSVCYGVDGLFSYYANRDKILDWPNSSALVISSGHSATHLFPIVNNIFEASKCKRLSVGGHASTEFMRKLLHLKYPWHRNFLTFTRAQYFKEDYCRMAGNYSNELAKYAQDELNGQHFITTVQLPYTPQPVPQKQDLERKAQTKKEQGNRLKELNERRKRERTQEQEERLAALFEIKALQELAPEQFNERMELHGMMTPAELSMAISELEESLGRTSTQPPITDAQLYPLVDVPDAELNEDELKEKKRQKFLKSMRDGRITAKRKREQFQQELEAAKQVEEEKYQKDPTLYISQLHERRKMYLDRREARSKKKQQIAAGGKRQAASQQRLKMLTQIESEEKKGTKRKATEDNFGADDKDWDVYLGDNDLDAEEDEAQLTHIESLLAKYDPNFSVVDENALPIISEQVANQIHLGLEKVRVPEILYQPHAIAGIEQMGLAEAIQSILSTLEQKTQDNMVMNIFFTGGNSLYCDFQRRLEKEIVQMRPFQSQFRVIPAADPLLDTWKGMSLFYRENIEEFHTASITRAEYHIYPRIVRQTNHYGLFNHT